jgi:rSAM/selenodomain-associated transferase 1
VSKDLLIVFVKAPRPGSVKTRLAQSIGAEAACHAYSQLTERVLWNVNEIDPVLLRFAPDEAETEITHWGKRTWRRASQGPGDLGERLARAFDEAFNSGCQKVVVIGSDCADVTSSDIQAAWAALANCDLVLGPAKDGGYWLMGLNGPQRALFENVPWSTDKVLEETLKRAKSAGLRMQLLRVLSDVDTEADWQAFQSATQVPIPGGRTC